MNYIDLYYKLPFTIAKLVVKLDSRWRRWVENALGASDWASENQALKDAEAECIEDLEAIHRSNAGPASQPNLFARRDGNLQHQAARSSFSETVF